MKPGIPNVIRTRLLDMQVCVPENYTDDQVRKFAERANPCGTEDGWHIRREGDPRLNGDPERVPCGWLAGHVHITLDA